MYSDAGWSPRLRATRPMEATLLKKTHTRSKHMPAATEWAITQPRMGLSCVRAHSVRARARARPRTPHIQRRRNVARAARRLGENAGMRGARCQARTAKSGQPAHYTSYGAPLARPLPARCRRLRRLGWRTAKTHGLAEARPARWCHQEAWGCTNRAGAVVDARGASFGRGVSQRSSRQAPAVCVQLPSSYRGGAYVLEALVARPYGELNHCLGLGWGSGGAEAAASLNIENPIYLLAIVESLSLSIPVADYVDHRAA
ncbi:hypothetical protein BC834DRAFT_878482 [Gloeopeniophorella convolvens]|nr:hypothetical protein BC834DRAFT_878482 [Gloeopeniophorella convolvens]